MINVDMNSMLQGLLSIQEHIDSVSSHGFPYTFAAFSETMHKIQNDWANAAMGRIPVQGFKPRFGARYSESILSDDAWNWPFQGDKWRIVIEPDPEIAHLVEDFIPAYDMKPGILAGPNAIHYSADGSIYKNIPYRHFESGKHGLNTMPRKIHELIKPGSQVRDRLTGEMRDRKAMISQSIIKVIRDSEGKIHQKHLGYRILQRGEGLKFSELPRKYQERRTHTFLMNNNPLAKPIEVSYQHKAPIHENLVRAEKAYEIATQPTYHTWRRMSSNSDPMAWWHPGFPENSLASYMEEKALEEVSEAIVLALAADIEAVFPGGVK